MQMPLETAHGTVWYRDGVLLCLEDSCGARGYGETMPLPGFGLEVLDTAASALQHIAGVLTAVDAGGLEDMLDAVRQQTRSAPGAHAAAETALLDLSARLEGRELASLLGGARRRNIEVGALLAARTPREVRTAAKRAVRGGFRTLKLKIAATTVDRDVARVHAARDAVGSDIALRLDANAGWDEATARTALERLESEQPEFVEQPVAATALAAMARLRASSPVPIAADESAASGAGAQAVIDRRAADLLILKPAALGGPRAAAALALRARAVGIESVVTNFLDSAVGDAAALQVAAVLHAPTRAAGLGTQSFFDQDLAAVEAPEAGARALPDSAGLGVVPDPARLAALANGPTFEASRC
jgi:o-succinylbenzoate synthase